MKLEEAINKISQSKLLLYQLKYNNYGNKNNNKKILMIANIIITMNIIKFYQVIS